jgi:hypothetical protein
VTRRWTLRLLAGLAAGAVVLSGCSERQEAADTLPEADATPSASEPELPPLGPPDLPMPAEARTQDAAGAEAFVRYYIDLINRTSTVMDAAPLREFSDGCLDCNRIASVVDKDATLGHQYDGGLISITTMRFSHQDSPSADAWERHRCRSGPCVSEVPKAAWLQPAPKSRARSP